METWQLTWLVGLTLGVIFGARLARDSAKTQAIQGGGIHKTAHYVACVMLTANAPTALLTTIFLGHGGFLTRLLTALALVVVNLLVAVVALGVYASGESSSHTSLPT